MKKKILSILITILAVCTLMLTMTACGKKEPPHTHTYDQQVASDTFMATNATCQNKATYYYSCACGEKGTETFEHGEALGHSFTNYTYNEDATCEEDGTETATCDNGCGEKDTRTKANSALQHVYSPVQYVWNENQCTATRICSRDTSHVETETVEGLFIKDADATCTTAERGHYIATFENPAFKTQITTQNSATNGNELGHDFTAWVSNNNGTHSRTCMRNGNHTETADCSGGTATCIAYAKCTSCNTNYGGLKPHTPQNMWSTTAKQHYHACTTVGCTEKINPEDHTFDKNKKCTVCEYVTTALLGTEISSNVYTINGTNLYVKVPNNQKTFYFGNTVNVADGATYGFYTHITGTGYIGSFLTELVEGDNVFYLIVKNGDIIPQTYTVTIYRRHLYEVTFDANGGSAVKTQTVEEDSWITNVVTTRKGYNFVGWDYDFGKPITQNVHATAIWNPRDDTKYTIEYYLQNIDDDGYSLDSTKTEILSGVTDTAIAITPSLPHFSLNHNLGILGGVIVPDGSLVLKAYFDRNRYDVVVTSNNAKAGTFSAGSGSYRYNKTLTLIASPNEGYSFDGWYESSSFISKELAYVYTVNKATVITAKFSPNKNTKYVVEYYLQNIDDDGYSIDSTRTEFLSGTTDETITVNKEITHFTLNKGLGVFSGTIAPDGSLVLKAYYTRNKYSVTANTDNAKAGSVTGGGNYKYQKEITLTATLNAGYTFLGWFDGEDILTDSLNYTFNVESKITLTAKYKPNEDTKYVIEYYLQNLDDTNYPTTCTSLETLKGTTDTEVSVTKTIAGFTLNQDLGTLSGTIAPDGSLVLKAYYIRNSYAVTVKGNNEKAGTFTDKSNHYKYDKEITLTATTNEGYTFLGWFDGEERLSPNASYTFNIAKDITITANWEAKKVSYTVECYLQNLGEDAYTLSETITEYGATDAVATVDREIAHFTLNKDMGVLTGVIVPDGSLVLKAYYTRNMYTLSNSDSTMGTITNEGTYQYGTTISATASTEIPYAFLGWYDGDTLLSEESTYVFNINCNVVAKFIELSEIAIFDFTVHGKDITITGLKDQTITELVIPNYVTSIGDSAFEGCNSLTSITIPNSVTSIGWGAFAWCGSLENITIPNSVTRIDGFTFGNCTSLTGVTIPNGVTSIGNSAFYHCSSLKSITIPDGMTSIGDSAFEGCNSLTSITIPDGVTSIGDRLFLGCSSLTSITIPDGVTSIGNSAFDSCYSLTSITIPNSVTSIGWGAFDGCILLSYHRENGLKYMGNHENPYFCLVGLINDDERSTVKTVDINANCKIIAGAFMDCISLTGITIPDGVTSIGDGSFLGCSSLTSITIPDGVTSIGNSAFDGCYSLTSITIPNSVTSIGGGAFLYCQKLVVRCEAKSKPDGWDEYWNTEYYNGPIHVFAVIWDCKNNDVADNGNICFDSYGLRYILNDGQANVAMPLSAIAELIIPESVTYQNNTYPVKTIGGGAFLGCQSLTKVVIPSTITEIGYNAFVGCSALQSVTIPVGVTTIHKFAFRDCAIIYCEAESKPDGWDEDWKGSNTVVIWDCKNNSSTEDGTIYVAIDGISYTIQNGEATVIGTINTDNLIIPNSIVVDATTYAVTSIASNAFYGCNSLVNVTIGGNVKQIGSLAFANCNNLTTVTIGGNVKNIDNGAFINCFNLQKVNFLGTLDSWVMITFYAEESNPTYYAKDLWINNVLVTNAIFTTATRISEYALVNCQSITKVVIGDSVQELGYRCALGCLSLAKIEVSETNSAFKAIDNIVYTKAGNILLCCAPAQEKTTIIIPDTVTYVVGDAFRDCVNIEKIVLPTSVVTIGSFVCEGCTNLTGIYYCGSMSSLSFVQIDNYMNDVIFNTPIYFYVEKESDVPNDEGLYWHYDENGQPKVWEK